MSWQGCYLTIFRASASSFVNLAGIVVRETANTFEVKGWSAMKAEDSADVCFLGFFRHFVKPVCDHDAMGALGDLVQSAALATTSFLEQIHCYVLRAIGQYPTDWKLFGLLLR